MNKIIEIFNNNLLNKEVIQQDTTQENFIKSAITDTNNESFVKEVFTKVQKLFKNNKDPRYPKKTHNFKINGNSIKLNIEINGIGFWLCKIENISLKYNILSIESLISNNLLNNSSNIKFENNEILFSNEEQEFTSYLFISYKLVYPISEKELNNKLYSYNLKGLSFNDYISFCKSFVEIYIHISVKLNLIACDELFFVDESFPEEIKIKLNDLIKNVEFLENIIKLNKQKVEEDEIINNGKYSKTIENLKEELKNSEYALQNYLKDYHKKDDNWVVFAYTFMKYCPVTFEE
jgi:hypothetical protein